MEKVEPFTKAWFHRPGTMPYRVNQPEEGETILRKRDGGPKEAGRGGGVENKEKIPHYRTSRRPGD